MKQIFFGAVPWFPQIIHSTPENDFRRANEWDAEGGKKERKRERANASEEILVHTPPIFPAG